MANSKNSSKILLEFYRYQILPIDRSQGGLFDESPAELIANKNKYFLEALLNLSQITMDEENVIDSYKLKLEYPQDTVNNNNLFVFRLAKQRTLPYDTPQFKQTPLASWPWVYLIVWNDADRQVIAIQHKRKVSEQTKSLINWLEKQVNKSLEPKNLNLHIKSIFDEQDFWDIVEKNQIQKVTFKLITPNMANISSALSDDMKKLAKSTNTQQSTVELTAYSDSVLELERDNSSVSDLVNYSSQGGGSISVKIKGIATRRTTSRSAKKTVIEEMEIQSYSCEDIINTIKSVID